MNKLPRNVPALEELGKQRNGAKVVHRRIEITVEREVVSIFSEVKNANEVMNPAEPGRRTTSRSTDILLAASAPLSQSAGRTEGQSIGQRAVSPSTAPGEQSGQPKKQGESQ